MYGQFENRKMAVWQQLRRLWCCRRLFRKVRQAKWQRRQPLRLRRSIASFSNIINLDSLLAISTVRYISTVASFTYGTPPNATSRALYQFD